VSIVIGTSGWQYADWRGRLYPRSLAQKDWLTYYSDRFQSVEVNNVFYRLPEKDTFERWAAATPEDFVFSLKASRYLTHVLRLSKPTEPVRRLLNRSSGLAHKVGPILLQLPANFRVDPVRLASTLKAFPAGVRVAFEPRHESWYTDEVADILRQNREQRSASVTPHSGSLRSGVRQIGAICDCTRAGRTRLPAMDGPPSPTGPGASPICGARTKTCTSTSTRTTEAVPYATRTASPSLPSTRDVTRPESRRAEKHR
jgi:uncharacterized protein YecE (DUF72 family)